MCWAALRKERRACGGAGGRAMPAESRRPTAAGRWRTGVPDGARFGVRLALKRRSPIPGPKQCPKCLAADCYCGWQWCACCWAELCCSAALPRGAATSSCTAPGCTLSSAVYCSAQRPLLFPLTSLLPQCAGQRRLFPALRGPALRPRRAVLRPRGRGPALGAAPGVQHRQRAVHQGPLHRLVHGAQPALRRRRALRRGTGRPRGVRQA